MLAISDKTVYKKIVNIENYIRYEHINYIA